MIPRGFVRFRRDAVGYGLRNEIKERLTIAPKPTSSFTASNEQVILRLWTEDGDYIGVPRGFFNTYLRGKYVDEFKFDYSIGAAELQPAAAIPPREGQAELIDRAVKEIQSSPFGGAIIEAKTAAGKTVLGLEVARRLSMKTLVIVHATVLIEQWQKEIQKFFPHWKVGILQADKIDIDGKDIVIGMLHSTSMKDYSQRVYQEFGTMVVDEVHVTGAPEFSKVLGKFVPKHVLGLSGTIERADRAQNVFIYGIGRIVKASNQIKVLDPTIYFIDTSFAWEFHGDPDRVPLDRQKIGFLRSLVTSETRNEILVRQICRAASFDRNILVMSERVSHLEVLHAMIKKRTNKSVGMMSAMSTKKERAFAEQATIICATNKMLGTGFNQPRLDTLVFASPIQAVDQPAGRIRRTFSGKKTPFILDPIDSKSDLALELGVCRKRRYSQRGWKMVGTDVFKRFEIKRKEAWMNG